MSREIMFRHSSHIHNDPRKRRISHAIIILFPVETEILQICFLDEYPRFGEETRLVACRVEHLSEEKHELVRLAQIDENHESEIAEVEVGVVVNSLEDFECFFDIE